MFIIKQVNVIQETMKNIAKYHLIFPANVVYMQDLYHQKLENLPTNLEIMMLYSKFTTKCKETMNLKIVGLDVGPNPLDGVGT
jgi:hypothetical protein